MAPPKGILIGEDGKPRCWWQGNLADYQLYHDEEWGQPTTNDQRLFEKICLEGFQSGLSWITILRKRDNFRVAFHQFDITKVAAMTDADVERLLLDKGIVRHRGKIKSTINNAKRALALIAEKGSLEAYFWAFEPTTAQRPTLFDGDTLMPITQTEVSTAISKDLKKRGWSFVGPTTLYAFMQAMGLVNDHLEGCICRKPLLEKRQQMQIP